VLLSFVPEYGIIPPSEKGDGRRSRHRTTHPYQALPAPHCRGSGAADATAPAGFGKTTLVSSWLEACDCPSAWLSLDENDDDLDLFLTYLLAAIRSMFPDACHDTQAMLKAATLPPASVIAGTLINELDQIEDPFILVLDDYYLIQNMAVHDLLSELLRHPPRALHLVLASRSDPLLPLTTLRARSQVTELRAPELRFTRVETAAFLEQQLGTPADDRTVDALMEQFEGWVTGLRLLTLSLRHRGSVAAPPGQHEPHAGSPAGERHLRNGLFDG
jgi:LuxR family maltose regulon positive regulatory protein